MQTATSETENKSLDLSICVHHYTLRAPCPKGQGNPALQQFQKSSKSASAGSYRPIWNSFATIGDRDFWHNGCMMLVRTAGLALMMPVPTQSLDR